MTLRTIGKVMCAFALICWLLKHIFEVEVMHVLVWVVIGLVGGLFIWISHFKAMDKE